MRIDILVSVAVGKWADGVELQQAYKESQGRIATFEKVLKERTPLTSIDDTEDFANYLNNLSMRTTVTW